MNTAIWISLNVTWLASSQVFLEKILLDIVDVCLLGKESMSPRVQWLWLKQRETGKLPRYPLREHSVAGLLAIRYWKTVQSIFLDLELNVHGGQDQSFLVRRWGAVFYLNDPFELFTTRCLTTNCISWYASGNIYSIQTYFLRV